MDALLTPDPQERAPTDTRTPGRLRAAAGVLAAAAASSLLVPLMLYTPIAPAIVSAAEHVGPVFLPGKEPSVPVTLTTPPQWRGAGFVEVRDEAVGSVAVLVAIIVVHCVAAVVLVAMHVLFAWGTVRLHDRLGRAGYTGAQRRVWSSPALRRRFHVRTALLAAPLIPLWFVAELLWGGAARGAALSVHAAPVAMGPFGQWAIVGAFIAAYAAILCGTAFLMSGCAVTESVRGAGPGHCAVCGHGAVTIDLCPECGLPRRRLPWSRAVRRTVAWSLALCAGVLLTFPSWSMQAHRVIGRERSQSIERQATRSGVGHVLKAVRLLP